MIYMHGVMKLCYEILIQLKMLNYLCCSKFINVLELELQLRIRFYQVHKHEIGIYVQKRHSDWMTVLRTILFEVLAITSDTFLPSFRQCVDARPKKLPLVHQTIFLRC